MDPQEEDVYAIEVEVPLDVARVATAVVKRRPSGVDGDHCPREDEVGTATTGARGRATGGARGGGLRCAMQGILGG